MDHNRHFTPLVFSDDVIPGEEARAATQKMAFQLSSKLKT